MNLLQWASLVPVKNTISRCALMHMAKVSSTYGITKLDIPKVKQGAKAKHQEIMSALEELERDQLINKVSIIHLDMAVESAYRLGRG